MMAEGDTFQRRYQETTIGAWSSVGGSVMSDPYLRHEQIREERNREANERLDAKDAAACAALSADLDRGWDRLGVFTGDDSTPPETTPSSRASERELLRRIRDQQRLAVEYIESVSDLLGHHRESWRASLQGTRYDWAGYEALEDLSHEVSVYRESEYRYHFLYRDPRAARLESDLLSFWIKIQNVSGPLLSYLASHT